MTPLEPVNRRGRSSLDRASPSASPTIAVERSFENAPEFRIGRPLVSIILPTFNRAHFLQQAIESINSQLCTDWELIVVDDGSTDDTPRLVESLTAEIGRPCKYIRQENQGAYAARNAGLDHAHGKYVAFFDSDDVWLPHHLKNCVDALEANDEVDWVYGACKIVDEKVGRTLSESTFYQSGAPRPFLSLRTRTAGRLRIIDDEASLPCMISNGLMSGPQNSVIRASVFDARRFDCRTRNEAEDQLFVIRCLADQCTLAYFDDVHVVYRVHESNSSAAGASLDADRNRKVIEEMIGGYEQLMHSVAWTPLVRRAFRRRLHRDYFWNLGYSSLLTHGRRREALSMFRRGLSYWPWNWRSWKTYALAQCRERTPAWAKTAWWCVSNPRWGKEYIAIRRRVRAIESLQHRALRAMRREFGDRVAAGPFAGLVYTPAKDPRCCNVHVLLGTYEKELHPALEEILERSYDAFISLGAAEGLYPCGLGIRNRSCRIVAFEAKESFHPVMLEMAQANNIPNIEIHGRCELDALRAAVGDGRAVCIVCDIDGPEKLLLDPTKIPALKNCDMLVETHDILVPGVTEALRERFAASHQIVEFASRPRTLDDLPDNVHLEDHVAMAAMNERRGGPQTWLWMSTGRGRAQISKSE